MFAAKVVLIVALQDQADLVWKIWIFEQFPHGDRNTFIRHFPGTETFQTKRKLVHIFANNPRPPTCYSRLITGNGLTKLNYLVGSK